MLPAYLLHLTLMTNSRKFAGQIFQNSGMTVKRAYLNIMFQAPLFVCQSAFSALADQVVPMPVTWSHLHGMLPPLNIASWIPGRVCMVLQAKLHMLGMSTKPFRAKPKPAWRMSRIPWGRAASFGIRLSVSPGQHGICFFGLQFSPQDESKQLSE